MNKKYKRIITVNLDTNEVHDVHYIPIHQDIVGSNILTSGTEKRKNAFLKRLDSQIKIDEMKKYLSDNVGDFIFLIYDYTYPLMSSIYNEYDGHNINIHIVRFLVLASYLNKDNNLINKYNHRVKKSDLKNIWSISNRNHINETYNLLLKYNYINIDADGYICLNNNLIYRGKIKSKIKELKKMNTNTTYTRVFTTTMKNLYESAKPRERVQLANFFKILPFVNYKYNIICSNPSETKEEKIQPLVWSEIAMICGYDISQTSRFRKSLTKFEINNKSVIGTFTDNKGEFISINPNLYYSGNDVKDIEFLAKLFNLSDKLGTKTNKVATQTKRRTRKRFN